MRVSGSRLSGRPPRGDSVVVRGCGHLRRRRAPARDSVHERGVSERERCVRIRGYHQEGLGWGPSSRLGSFLVNPLPAALSRRRGPPAGSFRAASRLLRPSPGKACLGTENESRRVSPPSRQWKLDDLPMRQGPGLPCGSEPVWHSRKMGEDGRKGAGAVGGRDAQAGLGPGSSRPSRPSCLPKESSRLPAGGSPQGFHLVGIGRLVANFRFATSRIWRHLAPGVGWNLPLDLVDEGVGEG